MSSEENNPVVARYNTGAGYNSLHDIKAVDFEKIQNTLMPLGYWNAPAVLMGDDRKNDTCIIIFMNQQATLLLVVNGSFAG